MQPLAILKAKIKHLSKIFVIKSHCNAKCLVVEFYKLLFQKGS